MKCFVGSSVCDCWVVCVVSSAVLSCCMCSSCVLGAMSSKSCKLCGPGWACARRVCAHGLCRVLCVLFLYVFVYTDLDESLCIRECLRCRIGLCTGYASHINRVHGWCRVCGLVLRASVNFDDWVGKNATRVVLGRIGPGRGVSGTKSDCEDTCAGIFRPFPGVVLDSVMSSMHVLEADLFWTRRWSFVGNVSMCPREAAQLHDRSTFEKSLKRIGIVNCV